MEEAPQPAPMDPLVAATMLRLLDASPELLDAYKDLELRAVLLGAEPDLEYRQQLQQHSQAADQLLTALATTLRLSRQWPQVQQRLIAEQKDRLAEQSAYKHDMAALREQLERQTVELERLRDVHQTALASHQKERDRLEEWLNLQRATLEAELHDLRQDYQKLNFAVSTPRMSWRVSTSLDVRRTCSLRPDPWSLNNCAAAAWIVRGPIIRN